MKDGKIVIAEQVSKDYKKYQVKNHPDTVDIAVTVVMGAPFDNTFCRNLRSLIEMLKFVFEAYDVGLNTYKDYHFHATVCPIIRTTFETDIHPDIRTEIQRQEIQNRALNPDQIKEAVCCTQPFFIEFHSWNIKIGGRGEILLWGRAKCVKGNNELLELRKRLRKIAGPHARDKGSKAHIALATIQDFHKLTGLQKKEIARNINSKLEFIPVPGSIFIDRVKLVQYSHRSLSRVESLEEIFFMKIR